MRRGAWIAVGAAAAAVLLVALALVRGGDSAGVALADAAERIEGESMRMTFIMGASEAGEEYSARGEGSWTADSSRGSAEMTITVANERPVRMTMLNIGRDYWFRAKEFASILPAGKRWVHSFDRAGPTTTLTPSQFTAFLADADEVEEVGEARVLDQPTTHYQGVLDLEDLADEIGGDTQEALEAAIEKENAPEGAKVVLPIEAWISEDGLPVRLRISAHGTKSSIDLTADILEYGVPVEVEPPPPSTVIEEAEFNRLTGG
jgi:hypothetical protein